MSTNNLALIFKANSLDLDLLETFTLFRLKLITDYYII